MQNRFENLSYVNVNNIEQRSRRRSSIDSQQQDQDDDDNSRNNHDNGNNDDSSAAVRIRRSRASVLNFLVDTTHSTLLLIEKEEDRNEFRKQLRLSFQEAFQSNPVVPESAE